MAKESFTCTCGHHIVFHDEDAVKCTVPGCRCVQFTPKPEPTIDQLNLQSLAELALGNFQGILVGLHQVPLGSQGIHDAQLNLGELMKRLAVLQAALHLMQHELAPQPVAETVTKR